MLTLDEINKLPSFAQGIIEGMRAATKQKWLEAATAFFARAVINLETAKACQLSGALDASDYFAKKTIWANQSSPDVLRAL